MLIKHLFPTSALILLLTGCQHPVSVRQPEQPMATSAASAETQVRQLAAVVAGGTYLREQCKDLQVPEQSVLLLQARELAAQRGWDTHNDAWQTLAAQSEGFYQGLLSDVTPVAVQCEFFKRDIGPLVQKG